MGGGGSRDRAASAKRHQPGPTRKAPLFPVSWWDAPGSHPHKEAGRTTNTAAARMLCLPTPSLTRFVSGLRLRGIEPSRELTDWEHGRRAVRGVRPCPVAVSDCLPSSLSCAGKGMGVLASNFRELTSRDPHAHVALPPSPIQVAAAEGPDSGVPGPERLGGKSRSGPTRFISRLREGLALSHGLQEGSASGPPESARACVCVYVCVSSILASCTLQAALHGSS
jgi:hypothetical protein